MHNEVAPTKSTESMGEPASELSDGIGEAERRRQEQSIGKAAMRAALLDAKPSTPSPKKREIKPLSDENRERFESDVLNQQKLVAESGMGPNLNNAILDRAEKAPDVYSNLNLVKAKEAISLEAVIAALSATGNNQELVDSLKSALDDLEISGSLGSLQYDHKTRRLINPAEKPESITSPIAFETDKKKYGKDLRLIMRGQAAVEAAETGQDPNFLALKQAERNPDLYSNEELVAAKLAISTADIIAALSVNKDQNESLITALKELKTPGNLRYDTKSKKLIKIAEPTSSSAIDFSDISPASQPPAGEAAA